MRKTTANYNQFSITTNSTTFRLSLKFKNLSESEVTTTTDHKGSKNDALLDKIMNGTQKNY